jgi:protein involved in polysaccharide export with SLBB domain
MAMVLGETAAPFSYFKVEPGLTVSRIIRLAGGTTPNADRGNIRLLKADGNIYESWIGGRTVEPGDTVIVPQRIRRDVNWQYTLSSLTPLAIMVNALRH